MAQKTFPHNQNYTYRYVRLKTDGSIVQDNNYHGSCSLLVCHANLHHSNIIYEYMYTKANDTQVMQVCFVSRQLTNMNILVNPMYLRTERCDQAKIQFLSKHNFSKSSLSYLLSQMDRCAQCTLVFYESENTCCPLLKFSDNYLTSVPVAQWSCNPVQRSLVRNPLMQVIHTFRILNILSFQKKHSLLI